MRYSTLGSTGIKVSCIGLGTATFGVAPLADDAERLLGRSALALGQRRRRRQRTGDGD